MIYEERTIKKKRNVHVYCTVLYCTVLYCTVLYCTVLYCTVLYCTVLYCTVLYCTILYCTVPYRTVPYRTTLALIKVKHSHYRPGQVLKFPGGWCSQISGPSAPEGGKVVSPTHRPPLPPRKYSWYSFPLEAESTPVLKCGRKDYVNKKISNYKI